jgi:hypothetical protein
MPNLPVNTVLRSFILPAFFVILTTFSIASAQTKTNSSGLVEGVWQLTQSFDTAFGRDTGTTNHYILLQKNGVARQRIVSMTNADWVKAVPNYQTPMFNPLVNSWIEGNDPSSLNNPNRPVLSFESLSFYLIIDQDGTYTRTGNTLNIRFAGECQIAHNLSKEPKCSAETFEAVIDRETFFDKNNPKHIYRKLTASNSQSTLLGNRKIETSKTLANRFSDLTGTWEGSYLCGQGLTNLILVITQNNSSEISAVFNFSASRNNRSVPSGSFKMEGSFDNKTNKITLRATDWFKQPPGYVTVDLVGNMSPGNARISGEILNSACSTFTVERR